jgi:hypothetical protein
MGRSGAREIVLHSAHDPGMARRLAETLVRNGIEVGQADAPVRVGERIVAAEGTFIVPMDQPTHRLIRNLLDPHTPMDPEFVALQVERRANRLRDQIYDVTAWSLPLLWDVEAMSLPRPSGAPIRPVVPDQVPEAAELPSALVGYLLPWGTSAAAAVAEALREGIAVRSAGAEFTLGGRRYGVGRFLYPRGDVPGEWEGARPAGASRAPGLR